MSGQVKEVSVQYQVSNHSCGSEDSVGSRVCPSGYKQTEIGVIPEDWEVAILDELSIISRLAGAEYTSMWKETINGEIIALRGFNIGKNKIIERDLTRISNKLSMKLKRSRLTSGDVIYPCVGTIGNAAVIEQSNTYHIQQNIARITPIGSKLNSYFLSHYLMSELAMKEVERFTATTSQPSVLVGSLRQYRIPLPCKKSEQTAIANALSDVDSLITSLEKLIAKKCAIKTAAMQQLLTGKKRLPPFDLTHTGYKQTELGEIPEDWVVNEVQDIANVKGGKRLPKGEQLLKAPTKHPYIRVTDMYVGGVDLSDIHYVPENVAPIIKNYRIKFGDLFISVAGTLGIVGKVPEELDGANLTENADKITDLKVDADYLLYSLMSEKIQNEIVSQCTVGAQPKLALGKIECFQIAVPKTIEEQARISKVLTDLGNEIDALEQRLNKTQQLKQGMMQDLLTGRTRLI